MEHSDFIPGRNNNLSKENLDSRLTAQTEAFAQDLVREHAELTDEQLSIWPVQEDSIALREKLLSWSMGEADENFPPGRKVAYAKEYLRRLAHGIV